MLEALLRIRCHFISSKHCCTMFSPTIEMYRKFNSQTMYPKPAIPDEPSSSNKSQYNDNDTELDNDLIDLFNEISLPDFYV